MTEDKEGPLAHWILHHKNLSVVKNLTFRLSGGVEGAFAPSSEVMWEVDVIGFH